VADAGFSPTAMGEWIETRCSAIRLALRISGFSPTAMGEWIETKREVMLTGHMVGFSPTAMGEWIETLFAVR